MVLLKMVNILMGNLEWNMKHQQTGLLLFSIHLDLIKLKLRHKLKLIGTLKKTKVLLKTSFSQPLHFSNHLLFATTQRTATTQLLLVKKNFPLFLNVVLVLVKMVLQWQLHLMLSFVSQLTSKTYNLDPNIKAILWIVLIVQWVILVILTLQIGLS